MILAESNIGILIMILSAIGFLAFYRKTEKTIFLIIGITVYLKLLFCTFALTSVWLFIIPEVILIIWLLIVLFKSKIYLLIPSLILLFLILILWYIYFVPYKVSGLPIFSLLILTSVWYFQKKRKEEIGWRD